MACWVQIFLLSTRQPLTFAQNSSIEGIRHSIQLEGFTEKYKTDVVHEVTVLSPIVEENACA